jgi:arylsulfatase A-like enzyme
MKFHRVAIEKPKTVCIALFLISQLSFAQTLKQSKRSDLKKSRPNVVLILTDDQGWGDLSLHGNQWVETPTLDGLARGGEQFTNCYVSPLCAPSRAGILTGRYPLRTGVISVSKGLEIMETEETTLAELFKANGYTTGIFGKWHNGQHYPHRPNDQGFDEFLGFCAGHLSNYFDANLDHNGKPLKTNGFITDVLTDAAMQFIASNKQKPFFCYIPYNAPHSPHQVPDKYFDKYKAKGLDNELASIYGMVDNLDENVGKLLTYLKKENLEENTIIIFLSDNGPNGNRYNGDMKGIKGSVHEGGVRVPFFISWKNHIPSGKIISTPIAHIDLYPTLMGLCQLSPVPGKSLDGISISASILQGKETVSRDRNIFTHVNFMESPVTSNSGGFRNNQYRFVFEKNRSQLYDLIQDPGEKKDLSQRLSEQTGKYLADYTKWFSETTSNLIPERSITLSDKGAVLPVTDAVLSAGIKFKEGHGWAHDWVEKWDSTQDSIWWTIDCKKSGKYIVDMDYLCKQPDAGSNIECRIGSIKEESIIPAFYSSQLLSPDRVPRKEAYEMSTWGSLRLGTFIVSEGKHIVRLKASTLANQNVAEVMALRVQIAD